MNNKALLYIILFFSVSLTVLVAAFYAILQIDPTILGFPPKEKPPAESDIVGTEDEPGVNRYDTIFIEPKFTLTREDFERYQKEILEKDIIEVEKDSLKLLKMALLDSISKIEESISPMRDSIKSAKDSLSRNKKQVAVYADSLDMYLKLYSQTESELEALEEKLKEAEDRLSGHYDSVEKERYLNYAKIYNNSSPEAIARILENLDSKDASKILSLMQKRKAGKVLDVLNPKKAAAILRYEAGKRRPNL